MYSCTPPTDPSNVWVAFKEQDLELPSRFEAGGKNKRHAKLKRLTCHSIGKEVYLWQSKTV